MNTLFSWTKPHADMTPGEPTFRPIAVIPPGPSYRLNAVLVVASDSGGAIEARHDGAEIALYRRGPMKDERLAFAGVGYPQYFPYTLGMPTLEAEPLRLDGEPIVNAGDVLVLRISKCGRGVVLPPLLIVAHGVPVSTTTDRPTLLRSSASTRPRRSTPKTAA